MSMSVESPAMERVPGWPVWGNTAAIRALRHALASGSLGHAYLLTGPPGVGRATRLGPDDAPFSYPYPSRRESSMTAPDIES